MQPVFSAESGPASARGAGESQRGRAAALIELSERLVRVMGVARALIGSGRRLDLTGIDDGVGILCAQTLDLAPHEGLLVVPHLCEVRAQADALCLALREHAGGAQ